KESCMCHPQLRDAEPSDSPDFVLLNCAVGCRPEPRKEIDPGRDITVRDTPRTDPDGRSLAHPVLISDDWRQSEPRDRDGAHAVEEASDGLAPACGSRRADAFGSGGEEYATTAPAIGPGTPPDCRGFPAPH